MPRLLRVLRTALPLVLLAACADVAPTDPVEDDAQLAPLFTAPEGRGAPGRYIVVYRDGASAAGEARLLGAMATYAGALDGFAGPLTPAELDAVRRDPDVAFVEEDQRAEFFGTQVLPAAMTLWGLDRIDQRAPSLNRRYRYTTTGAGVTAYVIDSGVEADHPAFRDSLGVSRVAGVFDVTDGSATDCMGHGTHVAGTIGSTQYGVAKDVQIRSLRVADDCLGTMYYSSVLAAIDWVYLHGVSPAVVNLSLGGGWSKATNQALDRLVDSGTFVVVAAGNNGDGFSTNGFSCEMSLAGSLKAYAVGAVDSTLSRALVPGWWGSAWGRCISIYAPGVYVLSSYLGGTNTVMEGTSMAAPHVTGVAARYLETHPGATPAQVRAFLDSNATRDSIANLDPGTNQYGSPNRLLFVRPAS